MKHTRITPDRMTPHVVTLQNGSRQTLMVPPGVTFGRELHHARIAQADIVSVAVHGAPLWYEPDYSL